MKSKGKWSKDCCELGEVLKETIERLGIKKKLEEAEAFVVWEEVVGSKIAANAQPYLIKDGLLFVSAINSTWAQELSLLVFDIKEKLNQRLGGEKIREIRFQCRGTNFKSEEDKKPAEELKAKLSPAEVKEIEAVAKTIDDKSLRETFKAVFVKDRKYKKIRSLKSSRGRSASG